MILRVSQIKFTTYEQMMVRVDIRIYKKVTKKVGLHLTVNVPTVFLRSGESFA
jgi:hypothetical protein